MRDHLNATDTVITPKVDSLDTRGSAPLNGNALEMDDRAAAENLDPSCSVGAKTSAFALRLSDDQVVPFDHSSNARIARQLHADGRLKHETKVFRAKVRGTLRNGTIRLESIQM